MRTFPIKEKSFFRKLRQYLREYVKVSNIHGLHYLVEKRSRAEKFYWVLILLISLSACGVMIYKVWEKYENNPIVISFAEEFVPIYEISFPTVTICPESKCAQSKFNYSDVFGRIVRGETVTDEERRTFHYVDLLCEHTLHEHPILPSTTSFIGEDFFDVVEKISPPFDAGCTFLSPACRCEKYTTPIITDQGICYSFNIVDRKHIFREDVVQVKNFYQVEYDSRNVSEQCRFVNVYPFRAFLSGADNSLEVSFTYNESGIDFMCSSYFQGYRVLVHNPLDLPRLSKNFFRVPHDTAVMVAIKPSMIKTSKGVESLDVKKRNCYLGHERPLKFFKIYTQSNCFLECLTNHTLKKCGCVRFYMPRINSTRLCGTTTDYCVENAEDLMKAEEFKERLSGSIDPCDCRPSCVELSYDVEMTQSDYWSRYQNKLGLENKEMYTSRMNVYFKTEQIMAVERKELYGLTDLISNFGGLLGLFTGFSLISLFEIIYFLSLRIFYNDRLYNDWSGSMC